MITKPIIYTKNIPKNPLLEVLVEEEPGMYEIIWFHWKFDGPAIEIRGKRLEDYEPVIIVYCKGELKLVLTRSSWTFQDYNLENTLTNPLTVLFKDSFHHYMVKTEEESITFERFIQSLELNEEGYDDKIRSINSQEIPTMFRNGIGHPTNGFIIPRQDPALAAREYYDAYCNE